MKNIKMPQTDPEKYVKVYYEDGSIYIQKVKDVDWGWNASRINVSGWEHYGYSA